MAVIADSFEKLKIVSIAKDQTVHEAASLMSNNKVGSVLILSDGKVDGIFTERDLLHAMAKGMDPNKTKVADLMTKDVCTIDISDTVDNCYQTMHKKGCRHIPIMENGKVVGMLTMRDLLDKMMREVEHENKALKDYMYS